MSDSDDKLDKIIALGNELIKSESFQKNDNENSIVILTKEGDKVRGVVGGGFMNICHALLAGCEGHSGFTMACRMTSDFLASQKTEN